MKQFTGLVVVFVAALMCAGLTAPSRVDYLLTPVFSEGTLRAVQVDLTFRGDADGMTKLQLPDSWGGQQDLYRGVEGLSVVSGAVLHEGEGPADRVLEHAPNASIHVRYRVIQDWPGEPGAGQGNTYRPAIQPGYFHLIGSAALIIPDIDVSTRVLIHARLLPRGWSFASDLQHASAKLEGVASSVTVGGDFRVVRAPRDPNIRIAIRGQWSFSDADFVARVAEIISSQRGFWGDASSPFLVTVMQLSAPDAGWTSIGGTGLDDAFAFFATPNTSIGALTRTLSHESTHTWIPGRIGGAAEEDEATQYWLSEGFTDFYTGRTLVRGGLWTPAEFAADLNDMLGAYAVSPVRLAPNARIVADFWNDQNVQKLPYQRGRMLATIWDARLRAAGAHDLDDVVLAMQARARGGDPLKAAAMFPVVARGMGLDVDADLERNIAQGAAIVLPEDVFAPCGRVITREVPEFHRGFDIAATQANQNIIAGVVRDGPAYAAGMRDGMVLVRRDAGEIGNAELEIAYVVRDGAVERTLRYMPRGSGHHQQQALVLAPDLSGETLARCTAVLGGVNEAR